MRGKRMYIYSITNTINDNVYVGKTIQTPHKRFVKHLYGAKRGDTTALHSAIRKHGAENFNINILEECSTLENLNIKEQEWIEKLNSYKNGYNETLGGEGTYGWHMPDEQKKLMSEKQKGKNTSWNAS